MATLTALKFDTPDGAAQMEALLLDLQKQQLILVEDAAGGDGLLGVFLAKGEVRKKGEKCGGAELAAGKHGRFSRGDSRTLACVR